MATCQHKDGCDKEATYRVVATYNGRQHVRLLCDQHEYAAVARDGHEHVRRVLEAQYGRFLPANTHTKYGAYGARGPGATSAFLRLVVGEKTTLKVGDTVRVVLDGYHVRRGEELSARWGIATVNAVSPARWAKHYARTYRLVRVPWPYEWQEEVGSIVAYPLHPSADTLQNGSEDKIRWRKHYAQQRADRLLAGG